MLLLDTVTRQFMQPLSLLQITDAKAERSRHHMSPVQERPRKGKGKRNGEHLRIAPAAQSPRCDYPPLRLLTAAITAVQNGKMRQGALSLLALNTRYK